MQVAITEFIDSRGANVRVDRAAGVLRGVKVLGLESRNGRSYRPAALEAARSLYEGAKVNVNHPKGHPAQPRDYQDRLGVIRHVSLKPNDGLYGDLFFNPKHVLAEQLAWDAEHAPENVGFSHNVMARTARDGDRVVVEAILSVQSVDLVADPATTRGLFEAEETPSSEDPPREEPAKIAWADITLELLQAHRPDLVEAILATKQPELEALRAELQTLREAHTPVASLWDVPHNSRPLARDQYAVEGYSNHNDLGAFVRAIT